MSRCRLSAAVTAAALAAATATGVPPATAQTFVLVDAEGATIPEVAPDGDAQRLSPFPWLTLRDLAATRDRPLFSPLRRGRAPEPVIVAEPEPEPEPEAEPEVEDAIPPRVRLAGVVINGALRIAMLHDEGTDEVMRLRPGQSLADWTLVAVEARSVLFRHGEQEHKIDLAAELDTADDDEDF